MHRNPQHPAVEWYHKPMILTRHPATDRSQPPRDGELLCIAVHVFPPHDRTYTGETHRIMGCERKVQTEKNADFLVRLGRGTPAFLVIKRLQFARGNAYRI
jgi:hypothetical protein